MRQVHRPQTNRQQSVTLSRVAPQSIQTANTPSLFELNNRKLVRDPELVAAVRNLDLTSDETYKDQLTAWLNEVYREMMVGQVIALFSKCYLGSPYVDHQLDVIGDIVEHYQAGQSLPAHFAGARVLARSDSYAYIEIYSDGQIIPIREDGTPG